MNGWRVALADRLSPQAMEPDPGTLAALLPLLNLIRQAQAQAPQTLDEALTERRRNPADPRVLAELIEQARERVAQDEARLCWGKA